MELIEQDEGLDPRLLQEWEQFERDLELCQRIKQGLTTEKDALYVASRLGLSKAMQ